MPYTLAWNESFPPDTQPANLLGDNIRAFKRDVRERVASFGAGTLADRPTPEAVFVGVMYFATDTGQIFRWSGAAWVDVTADFIVQSTGVTVKKYIDSSVVTILGGAGGGDGNTVTIPGGTLAVGSIVEIQARVLRNDAGGGVSNVLYFGAATVAVLTTGATYNYGYYQFNATVYVTGAATQRATGRTDYFNPSTETHIGLVLPTAPTEIVANNIIIKTSTGSPGAFNWVSDLLIVKVFNT